MKQRLSKDDLAQMNRDYFHSLDKERLVEVAGNLHRLAVEQLEQLEKNSNNSSRPPSSDSPYETEVVAARTAEANDAHSGTSKTNERTAHAEDVQDGPTRKTKPEGFGKRSPGKQPGAKGMWRTTPARSKYHDCPPP